MIALGDALHQALRLGLTLLLIPLAAVLAAGLLLDGARVFAKLRDPGTAAVVRLAAAVVALSVAGTWMFTQLERFFATVLAAIGHAH